MAKRKTTPEERQRRREEQRARLARAIVTPGALHHL